jgi:hypothetical protein
VRVDDLSQSYWTSRFDGARRAPQLQAQAAAALAKQGLDASTPSLR